MINENAIIRSNARETLSGKWGLAAGTTFVYILITGIIQSLPLMGPIITLLLTGAFTRLIGEFKAISTFNGILLELDMTTG